MKKNKYIIIKFNLKGFHKKLFNKVLEKILNQVKLLNINIKGAVSLPTRTHRFTVLRSPHINKTAREQFELKIYNKALITVFNFNNNFDKKKSKILINFILGFVKNLHKRFPILLENL